MQGTFRNFWVVMCHKDIGNHSGKLQLACTSPQVISTSPQTLFDQLDLLQSFCNLNFPKKQHLPVGQVKNKNHQPNTKIHQPRAIGHDFLCTPKVQNNNLLHVSRRMERMISRFEDFLVECTVFVISSVVKRCIFILVFFVL